MAFTKITNTELNSRGATTLPNQPTISAAALKQEFDAPAKEIVAPKFNNLIDELEAETAAANIGIETPTGRIGETIQEVLNDVSSDLENVENAIGNIDHTELEDAVAKRHSHENKDVLDEFSVSEHGNLLWDDIPVGGGGSDYENLENLPQINGHQLIGNKSDNDLDLASASSVASLTSVVGSMASDLGIAQSRIRNLQEVTTNLSNDKADKSDLGTASAKNSTSVVTDSTDLVESGAVYDALGFGNANLLDKSELTNKDGNTVTQITDGVIITLTKNDAYISTTCRIYGDFADKEIYLKFAYSSTGNVKPCISVRPYNANGNEIVNNRLDGVDIPSPVNIHRTMPTGTAYLMIVVYGTYNVTGSIGDTVTYTDIMVSTADIAYEPYHASVEETIPQVVSDAVGWDVGNLIPMTITAMKAVNTLGTWNGNIYTFNGVTFEPHVLNNGVVDSVKINGGTSEWTPFYLSNAIALPVGNYALSSKVNIPNNMFLTYTSFGQGSALSQNQKLKYVSITTPASNTPYIGMQDITVTDFVVYPVIRNLNVNEAKCDNTVIAPVENGSTASQAYAVGEHFIRNGAFCTVNTPISANEDLTNSSKFSSGDIADAITDLENGLISSTKPWSGNTLTFKIAQNNGVMYRLIAMNTNGLHYVDSILVNRVDGIPKHDFGEAITCAYLGENLVITLPSTDYYMYKMEQIKYGTK